MPATQANLVKLILFLGEQLASLLEIGIGKEDNY
jgi:hypothetical protein